MTEAGIAHNGRSMLDLAEFAPMHESRSVHKWQYKLAVINTDNVPSNGDKILKCVVECDFTTGSRWPTRRVLRLARE